MVAEADRFMDNADIPSWTYSEPPKKQAQLVLRTRLPRLNELIGRVDTISMRSDFDPKKYH